MTIQETIESWMTARQAELQLARAHSGQYDMKAHYSACTVTSTWAFRMINHPDWTAELADQWSSSAIVQLAMEDIAYMEDVTYSVSC